MRRISDVCDSRNNNFDFMRFCAAIMVLYSHSFPLSGYGAKETLLAFSGGVVDLGRIAVFIFFVISGFLVTQSYERTNNFFFFAKSRILRIFPGLILTLFLGAFIVGPIFTTYPLPEYFRDSQTYDYLKSVFVHRMSFFLPGVFENNSDKGVNGSLWTLEFECLFYLMIAIFGVFKILKKEVILIFIVLIFIASHLRIPGQLYFITPDGIELLKYSVMGMLLFLYRNYITLNRIWAYISTVLLLLSLAFNFHFKLILTIFGSYLIIYLAYYPISRLRNFNKYGDFSYGIYIYAFPIQQSIVAILNEEATPAIVFLLSLPLVLLLSYMSWHYVEKIALKLKRKRMFRFQMRNI